MTSRRVGLRVLTVATAIVAFAGSPASQTRDTQTELYQEIVRQDAAAFDAFNAHDLETLKTFFAEDLEFYHDQDGLISYAQFLEGSTRLFEADNGLRRDLVPDTVRVFPVPGYGAIQIGAHRFCHDENGRQDCGVFGFTHVWHEQDGRWRMTRVLSYDH